jgi:hypothetical protein
MVAPAQAAEMLAEALYNLKQARLPMRDVTAYVPAGPLPLPEEIMQVVEVALAQAVVAYTGVYQQGDRIIAVQADEAQGPGALFVLVERTPALPRGLSEASALLAERFPGASLAQPVAASPDASAWAEGYLLQGAAAEAVYLGACLPHQEGAVVVAIAASGSLREALALR